ncbi:MAG: hypothetical protein R3F31_15755 [Verrucomicrobiales bacterium]
MWKVFLVISMVVLGGAGFLGYQNQEKLKETYGARVSTEKSLGLARDDLEKTKGEVVQIVKAIEDVVVEIEKVQTQKSGLETTKQDDMIKLTELKNQLEGSNAELAKAKEFLALVPEIEKVKEDLMKNEQRILELQQAVANAEASIAQANLQQQKVEEFANEKAALLADIAAGRIRGEFASSIKKAFNDWGFVIIEGI